MSEAAVVSHGAGHAAAAAHEGGGIPHIANWLSWFAQSLGEHSRLGHWIETYEDLLFAGIVIVLLSAICWAASRKMQMIPRGIQNVMELIIESLNDFIAQILGPDAREHTPFVGALFLYIWIMNLIGLVPGFKSPTANLNTTLGLAICVFVYVQWIGLRNLGIKGYFSHMMANPSDGLMVVIGLVFILPVHLVGELVKPISLAMRLGFNITGEDAFLAVAVGFGPFGIILQLIAMGLSLICATAQALVFSTLSTVFISQMSAHHGDDDAHSPSAHATSH